MITCQHLTRVLCANLNLQSGHKVNSNDNRDHMTFKTTGMSWTVSFYQNFKNLLGVFTELKMSLKTCSLKRNTSGVDTNNCVAVFYNLLNSFLLKRGHINACL